MASDLWVTLGTVHRCARVAYGKRTRRSSTRPLQGRCSGTPPHNCKKGGRTPAIWACS